ncbi:MAG: DUF4147 domain-containing protein [Planctomycetaceae bacterium]
MLIAGEKIGLDKLDRLIVVGAGKAGAGMATAIETQLESILGERLEGWVNVPADCVKPLKRIHLHAARPAGLNEPTAEGVRGAEEILKLVRSATSRDLILVLISGGGSALLPAPVAGISLEDKQEVTRFLAAAGAPIEELNQVRRTLSSIKGGGLARNAANSGWIISLIISDVIGDPLEVIASGPTVETHDSPQRALEILRNRTDENHQPPAAIMDWLEQHLTSETQISFPTQVQNHLIGTNSVALQAAAEEALNRGYQIISLGSNLCGEAAGNGRDLMKQLLSLREGAPEQLPVCLLSGGEPTVTIKPSSKPRKGGRNQELVLAALDLVQADDLQRVVLLSGGTDGEDGPTDAAGGFIDEAVRQEMLKQNLDPTEFLAINNSYPILEATGGLLKTGPTHTNVMDLRVGLVDAP